MKDFKDLTREERRAALKALGQQSFREGQIFEWICRGARSFDEMSNLSKELRASLSDSYTLGSLSVEVEQISSDGTRKYLLGLPDGNSVEAVLMRYEYGNSLCISTQVGCRMGCSFCASTIGGKLRDLKAWEMLDEFVRAEKYTGEPVNHLVLMGIGEPFDNYAEVSEFLRRIHDKDGKNLSFRSITVSTCGLVPKIYSFAEDFPQVNLAISLHAATQEKRERLMPVAKAYRLDELIKACREVSEKTGRRVSFEYTLIAGKNDGDEDAREIISLLRGMLCHVNLIPLNPVRETGLSASTRKRAEEFRDKLEKGGIPATVRRTLGSDIDAACGQLRKKASANAHHPG
jgi:23S rRNA (adenine2503-C2)-methyltransferase